MVGFWNLGLKMIPNDRPRSSLGPPGDFGQKNPNKHWKIQISAKQKSQKIPTNPQNPWQNRDFAMVREKIKSQKFLKFFFWKWPPGKSWKHDFSDIPWTLGPSGPSLDSRAQNSIQDSLNESSVRPNGTPVMPLLHFGHGWLFRSKTTNYLLCKFSYEGNNTNNNNQRFRWQEPPGKIMFLLFCFATCRDEEKETQNINVVGKIRKIQGIWRPGERKSKF